MHADSEEIVKILKKEYSDLILLTKEKIHGSIKNGKFTSSDSFKCLINFVYDENENLIWIHFNYYVLELKETSTSSNLSFSDPNKALEKIKSIKNKIEARVISKNTNIEDFFEQ